MIGFSGYDQQTLADDLTCEDTTKQFRLSREDIKICRAYHDIYHFEKHLIESCRNKFFCLVSESCHYLLSYIKAYSLVGRAYMCLK